MARVLIGFMGAGKTTVGQLLSDQLYDMDAILEDRIGMPIKDFFEQKGEPAFRQLETDLLKELLALGEVWISPGGGVVLNPANRALLRGHDLIFLEADFETVYDRISQDKDNKRPLFLKNSKEDFKAIFDSRQVLYQELATMTVSVADKSPGEIAELIRTGLNA